jgi:2-dehydro-3-deoxygluconokinase
MAEVITFGETMAAFVPAGTGPLRYVTDYHMRIAGAESNTAIGLAKLGHEVSWISRLGRDEFGQYICNSIRSEGVDCSHVIYDEAHRTGIMFKQISTGETSVTYYRQDSAASHMRPEDLDASMFAGAKYLHISGITPVLSEDCYETILRAMELAKEYQVKISFDPNIRRKLWKDQDYTGRIRDIAVRSQILLMGLDEAEVLFGSREPQKLQKQIFSGSEVEMAAMKNGAAGAWVADRASCSPIEPYPCKCIDPVGAGDGFNAGFLAGLLEQKTLVECGQLGAIIGALATENLGDTEGYPDRWQLERITGKQKQVFR